MAETPQWVDYQFMSAEGLSSSFGQVNASIIDIDTSLFTPGLLNAANIVTTPSGLSVNVTFGASCRILFADGVLAGGYGTTAGIIVSTYSVNLASFVPPTGSQVVYIVASAATIGQNQVAVPGPPPGHPDYDPEFVAYNTYTYNLDTVALSATTTAPDNATTIEICRTTLIAGQSSITSVDTSHQYYGLPIAAPHGAQMFTSSGNFTVPPGVTQLSDVEVWGGGGGGSGGQGSSGAGGGYVVGNLSVTPGQVISVTVGSGGSGASSAAPAGNGGTSSILTLVATGGTGGGPGPGFGGVGSGGYLNIQGQPGTDLDEQVTYSPGAVGNAIGGNAPRGGMGGNVNSAGAAVNATPPGGGGGANVNIALGTNGATGWVLVRW